MQTAIFQSLKVLDELENNLQLHSFFHLLDNEPVAATVKLTPQWCAVSQLIAQESTSFNGLKAALAVDSTVSAVVATLSEHELHVTVHQA